MHIYIYMHIIYIHTIMRVCLSPADLCAYTCSRESWTNAACMYVCMHVCMHACMYVCVCMCVCVYVYMYVCMYACMYVCMHVCLCVCMCVCVYVCMYVCMCIIYIHAWPTNPGFYNIMFYIIRRKRTGWMRNSTRNCLEPGPHHLTCQRPCGDA